MANKKAMDPKQDVTSMIDFLVDNAQKAQKEFMKLNQEKIDAMGLAGQVL
jgi:hypothetical protein